MDRYELTIKASREPVQAESEQMLVIKIDDEEVHLKTLKQQRLQPKSIIICRDESMIKTAKKMCRQKFN